MIETATGLVMRTFPLTETSLIVHWLTPSLGRISTVAKGARRPKSSFRGKIDLFYLADFSFQRSRKSDLHALREIRLQDTNAFLRQDLALLRQAAYASALVSQSTEKETPLPEIYALVREFLAAIAGGPALPHSVFAFELRLLGELGLEPDLTERPLTPGSQKLGSLLASATWDALKSIRLTGPQVREIQSFLHGFIVFHLGKIPAGRAAAIGD
ncbi:MAG: DNA repair protein RecO [Verrucomicrobiota bacterium]